MTQRTLAEWRKRKGFNQTELAKKVDVSRPTIARYEGKGFGAAQFETVFKILKALDKYVDSHFDNRYADMILDALFQEVDDYFNN